MYLTIAELKTHLYPEIVNEITREDDAIVTKAISAAISEAKSYLGKFDLMKLFGDDNTPATVKDENLKNKVKDLACWHVIKLANPNIEMALFRTAYEDAIKFLKDVTKGFIDPADWPYRPKDANTGFPQDAPVFFRSNQKRGNHY